MSSIRHQAASDDVKETYGWGNQVINSFRIDPHEFSKDTCGSDGNPTGNPVSVTYYYDYIKLKKDVSGNTGTVNIVYSAQDADTTSPSISFYYSATQGSLGTLIDTITTPRNSNVYSWNVSQVPEGTYYINAKITDSLNTTTTYGKGRVKIGASNSDKIAPELNLEAPNDNESVSTSLQVKGFALMGTRDEDVVAVEYFIDDNLIQTLLPSLYSPKAKELFRNVDVGRAGFDTVVSLSSVSSGVHKLSVKAYASDGGLVTVERTFNKNGIAQTLVADPDPAGSPVNPTGGLTIPPTATSTPTPKVIVPSLSKPGIKASQTASGLLTIKFSNIGTKGCSLNLSGGVLPSSLTSTKTFKISGKEKKSLLSVSTILNANKSKLKSFNLSVNKKCGAETSQEVKVVVKTKSTKGSVVDNKGLLKALRKLK